MLTIVTRSNPLVDIRIKTICQCISVDKIVEINSCNIVAYDASMKTVFTHSLRSRFSRLFQTRNVSQIIEKIVNEKSKILAIDVDVIKICARLKSTEKFLDLHENDFEPVNSRIRYRLLAAWYKFLFIKYKDRYSKIIVVSDGINKYIKKQFSVANVLTIQNINLLCEPIEIPHKVKTRANNFVYHGVLSKERQCDRMIAMFAEKKLELNIYSFYDNKFSMDLKNKYQENKIIKFHDAIKQSEIIKTISQHEVGVFIFDGSVNQSLKECMPNKLYEFIFAGLPFIFGSSESVKSFVLDFGLGVVCDDFEKIDQSLLALQLYVASGQYTIDRERFLNLCNKSTIQNKWKSALCVD